MALPMTCSKGHDYIQADEYRDWPMGAPHCPECYKEWVDGHRFIHPRQTFAEVLGQSDDQVLVRQLLMDLVPEDVKWRIVFHFNKSISERNLRALDTPATVQEFSLRGE